VTNSYYSLAITSTCSIHFNCHYYPN